MSGQKCKCCHHENRKELDQALIRDEPYTEIVARFGGFSESSLKRHKANCIFSMILKAKAGLTEKRVVDLHAAGVRVMQEAGRIGEAAEQKKQFNASVNALNTYLKGAEFLERIQGKNHTNDFTRDPMWLDAVARLFAILGRFPDALEAVRKEWAQPTSQSGAGNGGDL